MGREKLECKAKCFNGLSEFYLDSDGRGLHCGMGKKGSSNHSDFIQNYDYNLMKLFRSRSVRRLRKNCKQCKVKCQQLVYFFPHRDSFFSILWDLIKLRFSLVKLRIMVKLRINK